MGAIGDDRTVLVDKLAAAGLNATGDPSTVAPMVLVGAPDITPAGIGGWTVVYPVHVVAAPPADAEALDDLLDRVETVLRTAGPSPARPTSYGEPPCPAYELLYRRDVTNPDC